MQNLGVVEGFFGPEWPEADRKSYASFLAQNRGEFYIYAPKRDAHLRKEWRAPWSPSYTDFLTDLIATFHKCNVKFGLGFSPFGLGSDLSEADKRALKEKLQIMQKLGIDLLGLFFDDMPVTANLAQTQIETLNFVREHFPGKIIFCPSFYTPDPILDKVFGQRPEHYLDDIAVGVPTEVAIAWTGPKVISPTIDQAHLKEVTTLLKRSPFIWENLFANDGPRNCKFLKLRAFSGREAGVLELTEAFAFNLMNQPQLSKILFLASVYVLRNKMDSDVAFGAALEQLCSSTLKDFILAHKDAFLNQGLDQFDLEAKELWITELKGMEDQAAQEIIAWLEGKYLVGPECLTD